MPDDPQMKNADYCVCLALDGPPVMPDNLIGECCRCGRTIQHRPTVPRRVRKLCMACGVDSMHEQTGPVDVLVTDRQRAEIEAWRRRQDH